MAFDWLNAAVTLGGGLLGANSSSKGTSTTSENKLDPRMDRYVYGADGQSGLMGSAFDLAQQQLKTGGLNDMQRQGLDMQRQYLMSPQYQQGFGNMANLGQSLMGGGVAGNPFTGGGPVRGGAPASPFSYSGTQNAAMPDYKMQPSLVSPQATQSQRATNGLLGGGGQSGGGQGGGASGGLAGPGGFAAPNDQDNAMGTTFSDDGVKSVAMMAAAVLGIPMSAAAAVAQKANQMFGTVTVDGMAAAMAQMDAQAAENNGGFGPGVSQSTGGGGNNNRSDGPGNNGYGGGRGFGSGTNQQ